MFTVVLILLKTALSYVRKEYVPAAAKCVTGL